MGDMGGWGGAAVPGQVWPHPQPHPGLNFGLPPGQGFHPLLGGWGGMVQCQMGTLR